MTWLPPPTELLTVLSGWLVAAFGWLKWLFEVREKRRERSAKEQAQAALTKISRRAANSNPLFFLSVEPINGVTIPFDKPTELFFVPAGHPCLLCFIREAVDRTLHAGEFVYLLVENHGSAAYELMATLDGVHVRFVTAENDGNNPLYAICYPYCPSDHGKEQYIEVTYLATNGVRDTHRYATKHGIRSLRRVDPA